MPSSNPKTWTIWACPDCGQQLEEGESCGTSDGIVKAEQVEVVALTAMQEVEDDAQIALLTTRERLAEVERRAIEAEGKLEKLREIVELECDGLATVAAQFDWANDRACIAASETRLLSAARAATLADSDPPEEPTGERCGNCGAEIDLVWWCHDSFLWEAVTGEQKQPGREPAAGTWCIRCFDLVARDLCEWIEWAPVNHRHLLKPEIAERIAAAHVAAEDEPGEAQVAVTFTRDEAESLLREEAINDQDQNAGEAEYRATRKVHAVLNATPRAAAQDTPKEETK